MTVGSAYMVRVIVLRKLGSEAMGLYQSAWTVGGLYISFILQAMGADFYPRLTASANDNTTCNRMVNEQVRVGLLLAGPGVIATLTCAPLVTALFYSSRFHAAAGVLRWFCLGTTLQVITWPLGFISLAKARATLFFWSDFSWTAVYLLLSWVCLTYCGLNGAGIAYFAAYVFHAIITYPIARYLSGFRWSRQNAITGLSLLLVIGLVFCGVSFLPVYAAAPLGVLCAIAVGLYSGHHLLQLVPVERLPSAIRRIAVARRPSPGSNFT